MDRIEAMTLMQQIKNYLTAGNPVWDVDEISEALDIAIEALRNEINCVKCVHYTERETYTGIKGVCKMDTAHREDLIRRLDALKPFCIAPDGTRIPEVDCDNFPVEFSVEFIKKHLLSLPSAELTTNLQPSCNQLATDLISRQDAIRWVKTECNPYGKPTLDFESGKKVIEHLEQMPSAEEQDDNRLYIKIYANDEPSRKAEKLYQICGETESREVAQWLKEYFPSVDRPTTDCTEFMEWIKAEVLDENNWELNAVAYGEIICRKLKKLGWIDVEDGCYVDTRPTGEWVLKESEDGVYWWHECSECGEKPLLDRWMHDEKLSDFCWNCGSKMFKGGEGE